MSKQNLSCLLTASEPDLKSHPAVIDVGFGEQFREYHSEEEDEGKLQNVASL